jgi:replication initiation and membrane attachment protein DnaB
MKNMELNDLITLTKANTLKRNTSDMKEKTKQIEENKPTWSHEEVDETSELRLDKKVERKDGSGLKTEISASEIREEKGCSDSHQSEKDN